MKRKILETGLVLFEASKYKARTSKRLVVISIASAIFFAACRRNFDVATTPAQSDLATNLKNTSKPNIIIILADDIGYEVPACDGGQSYETPNIDMLAINGRRFTQCHSAPMCSPSRFMLLTGKYNFRNYTTWGYMATTQRTIGNMLQDAGYVTCYTGKWQLGGGDTSIHKLGWQKYAVWLPFLLDREKDEGSRYKGAKIYENGEYLPQDFTMDKYADDLFTKYLLQFIDSVHKLNKPFFCYYSMNLCHAPFTPPPDHSDYTTFKGIGDTKYFPAMVSYMDKKIGQIITHLKQPGLFDNTLIMFLADNGSPPRIRSRFNGFTVNGGKTQTTEPGTNVPLIVTWSGITPPGTTSDALIDFTDFMPTLAKIAGIPEPQDYGKLDGVSFYDALTARDDRLIRKGIYDAYAPNPSLQEPFVRWAQTYGYKLYDRTASSDYTFVKIKQGKPDGAPLLNLTSEQEQIRENLKKTLVYYRLDGRSFAKDDQSADYR